MLFLYNIKPFFAHNVSWAHNNVGQNYYNSGKEYLFWRCLFLGLYGKLTIIISFNYWNIWIWSVFKFKCLNRKINESVQYFWPPKNSVALSIGIKSSINLSSKFHSSSLSIKFANFSHFWNDARTGDWI